VDNEKDHDAPIFNQKPETRNFPEQFLMPPWGTRNDEKARRDLFSTLDLKP
jgi:hypothetical protein